MENKYYTPQLEELFVGYECELFWNRNYFPEDNWYEIRVGEGGTEDFDLLDWNEKVINSKIRTPYLTREQIREEGWILKGFQFRDYLSFERGDPFVADGYSGRLEYNLITKILKISITVENKYTTDGPECRTVYNLPCKSINEFRKINELL